MTRRFVLLLALTLALGGWSCTTATVETTALKAKSVTVDTILLAHEAAKLAGATFDRSCPNQQLFTLEQCRGWRQFAEGHAPADVLCKAPTFLVAPDVLNKCGFKKAFPLVIRSYTEGKDTLDSITAAVTMLLGGTKTFAATANKAEGR